MRAYNDRFGAERLDRLLNDMRALAAAIKDVK